MVLCWVSPAITCVPCALVTSLILVKPGSDVGLERTCTTIADVCRLGQAQLLCPALNHQNGLFRTKNIAGAAEANNFVLTGPS